MILVTINYDAPKKNRGQDQSKSSKQYMLLYHTSKSFNTILTELTCSSSEHLAFGGGGRNLSNGSS